MIFGYVRISTRQQSIERQIRNIKSAYPDAYIVQEVYTGTKIERPQFGKLMRTIKSGDTLVCDSVSRFSRNADDGFKLYQELYSKNIELEFLKEPQINTTTYKKAKEKAIPLTNTAVDYILEGINRYLLELAKEQIVLAFEVAQKEVDDLHVRTKEGLLSAKLAGKPLGHRKNEPLITKKSIRCKDIIRRHSKDFGGTLNDKECIALCQCSKKSYYRYKKELMVGYKPI